MTYNCRIFAIKMIKVKSTVAFILLWASLSLTAFASDAELVVMTLNIRFDNPSDGVNAWPNRISMVEAYMDGIRPDIIGMQENLLHQNEELLRIIPGYEYVGTGRTDGAKEGEFSPLFFRTDRFELLEHGQFWLSETPDVPGSIGWEAVLPRVVAWAKLSLKETGQELYAFNTHYSHVSNLARRRSMAFMSEQIRKIAGDAPVIVTGDLNITKGEELYYDMLAHLYQNNRLQNAELISDEPVVNAKSTINAFRDDTPDRIVDYIFVDPHFRVRSYQVDQVKDGEVFISDHWPVWVRLRLKQ